MLDAISNLAKGFIGLFNKGGETLLGLATGILPTLIVLMTAVNAIIKILGEERVNKFAKLCTKNIFTRYTILPVLAILFLTNPMCYTFGRFIDEKYKPAYYDATVSFLHPVTSLFPHANSTELFVFMGVAQGITQLGLDFSSLAVRYFLVGIIVIFIRGIITERITIIIMNRNHEKVFH
ncbi:MAG: PTS glucitol/sorbitol transporter subunit IIC [Clostridiaceae bacterium]